LSERSTFQQRALVQQGYGCSTAELAELEWGLRFTPSVCMLLALYGLATQQAYVHFALAALGILPFWFPEWHPFDVLYNHLLRPLWNGVRLPSNPLPRRIACVMGGSMNLGIGFSFLYHSPLVAYLLGGVLIALQLVVITTHFCLASWIYEGLTKIMGVWSPPIPVEQAKELLGTGAHLIDVRSPADFSKKHIPGAINIPLGELDQHLDEIRDQPVVVYCQRGVLSQIATRTLKGKGLKEVYNLGGIARWE
jgi:rhodanese-related sulfurtransferase